MSTFTCPGWPEWKHLNSAQPAFYNATDAHREQVSMEAIRQGLRDNGMWKVYEDDVLSLEPILAHMTNAGMPLNADIRQDRAEKLAGAMDLTNEGLETLFPLKARRIGHVYKTAPKDTTGLSSRDSSRDVKFCDRCGTRQPGKAHFKVFKRKANPCAGANVVSRATPTLEYYRLAPFKLSSKQLMSYQRALGRLIPKVWDAELGRRKPTMNEKAIIGLMAKYPLDQLYPLVLEFRKLQKLAGTYIGYPVKETPDV